MSKRTKITTRSTYFTWIILCYLFLFIALVKNVTFVQAGKDVYIPSHHNYQLKDVMLVGSSSETKNAVARQQKQKQKEQEDDEQSDDSSDDDLSLPSDPNDALETDEPESKGGKEKLQSDETSETTSKNAEKEEGGFDTNDIKKKHDLTAGKDENEGQQQQTNRKDTEGDKKQTENEDSEENEAAHGRSTELTGKFIHVTDFHFDPKYKEGATVKSYCHRLKKSQQKRGLHDHHHNHKGKKSKVAGKFGALGSDCDSPEALIQATFDFIKKHKVDFIVYTGDSAPHDHDPKEVLTYDMVISAQEYIAESFGKSSPSAKVLPVIGNNDVREHNMVSAEDIQIFHDIWQDHITKSASAVKGYFVEELQPGKLRSIQLETMEFLASNANLPDCDQPRGPGRLQLDWLRQMLRETRAQKAKTYLVAHVPPNDKDDTPFYKPKCYQEYYSILGSYSDVILGHFSGHFNHDQLTAVLQNKKDGSFSRVAALGKKEMKEELLSPAEMEQYQVVGALLAGPSIIPKKNPAIRIYTYQTKENARVPIGTILDWEQYYTDLNEANAKGVLEYRLEYTASNTYGVGRFDRYGLQQLFATLSFNETVRQDYVAYRKVQP